MFCFQYDPRFANPFWNSSEQSLSTHLLSILTSWALVVDVWYLPPQKQRVISSIFLMMTVWINIGKNHCVSDDLETLMFHTEQNWFHWARRKVMGEVEARGGR